jgi:hypothetical protein
MKRNLYLNQHTGSSTAHVSYFTYFHWRASEPKVSFRTQANSYRSNLKNFIEVRICLVRISSNNVRDSERDAKTLKIMEWTRDCAWFEMCKWLQNSWTGNNSLLTDTRIDKTMTCTLKERWLMSFLLRIWEWEGVTRILIIKPNRCNNFSNLFWNELLYVSDGSCVHHQELFTVHSAMVCVIKICRQLTSRIRMFDPDSACKLSANVYDVYHCCAYREKLPMMDKGTVRNT